MAKTYYPAGWLDDIEFVAVYARYGGKWVYCFHKKRKSFEHPGGHVEPGETPMQAARRELWEESGIQDCQIIPLWDYEFIWENGEGRNNGRVYFADAHSIGELPENEMERVELFCGVPEQYTYDNQEEERDLAMIQKMLLAYEGVNTCCKK